MRAPEYDPRYAEPVRQATAFSPFTPAVTDRLDECAKFCGPKPITCVNCGGCMIHSESCAGKAEEFRALVEKTRKTMDKIEEKDRKARSTLSYYGQLLAFDTTRSLHKIEILDFLHYMNEAKEDLK